MLLGCDATRPCPIHSQMAEAIGLHGQIELHEPRGDRLRDRPGHEIHRNSHPHDKGETSLDLALFFSCQNGRKVG